MPVCIQPTRLTARHLFNCTRYLRLLYWSCSRLCRFCHVPVQSTVEYFEDVVRGLCGAFDVDGVVLCTHARRGVRVFDVDTSRTGQVFGGRFREPPTPTQVS